MKLFFCSVAGNHEADDSGIAMGFLAIPWMARDAVVDRAGL